MNLKLNDRRSGAGLNFVGVKFRVVRAKWDLYGGPSSAVVEATGPTARLAQLVQVLRAAAVLSDDSGAACWWGYVHAVEVQSSPTLTVRTSLDDLYNRVAVRYRDERISPEVNIGWQFQTAWVQDTNSITEYGKREGVFRRPYGFPAEALLYAGTLLARYKRPVLAGFGSAAVSSGRALLHLRGWWDTLGWMFFSEARGYIGFNGGGAVQSMGNLAASTVAAESFTVGSAAWSCISAWVKIGKYGSPADNVSVTIRSDSAGSPNTVLATATVAGSTLTGDLGWVRFDFGSALALSASTTYWLCVARSGALDANNYYRLAVDEGVAFAGGALKLWNGGAWGNRTPNADLVFSVNGQSVTTDQIKVMADPSTGGGQFLAGVFVQDASAVNAYQYRDGKETCLEEVKNLLDMGTSTGERLHAVVNAERWLVVRKVGSATVPLYTITAAGELRDRSGMKVGPGMAPVGKWARVQGLDQAGGDGAALGVVLLTGLEWDGQKIRVVWE